MGLSIFHRLLNSKTDATEDLPEATSRSNTPNSSSTYAYSHEPFATFQRKVERLAKDLYHTESVTVKQVRGGSYNRIVGVTIRVGTQDIEGVFRIPRYPFKITADSAVNRNFFAKLYRSKVDQGILNGASFFRYIGKQSHLAIPSLLAFDATAKNKISSPYLFQQLAVGVPLIDVYESMTSGQKLGIADELATFLVHMESFTFPNAGRLHAPQGYEKPTSMISVDGLEHGAAPEVRGFLIHRGFTEFESQPYKSLAELLEKQLRHWASCEQSAPNFDPVKIMWNRLLQILEEMRVLGYFSESDPSQTTNVLFHWDLEPRNIMVHQIDHSVSETGPWKFSKVIDWDDCLVLPSILTRKPPVWLWHFVDDLEEHDPIGTGYDGDVDLLPPHEYPPQLSPDNIHLRSHFQENYRQKLAGMGTNITAGEMHDQMYGKGRWTRRLARFAIHGASDNQDLKRFEKFDREWSDMARSSKS